MDKLVLISGMEKKKSEVPRVKSSSAKNSFLPKTPRYRSASPVGMTRFFGKQREKGRADLAGTKQGVCAPFFLFSIL